MKKAVIVANGLFPRSDYVLGELKKCDLLICCDGAIHNLLQIGIQPHVVIGDLDSADMSLIENLKCTVIHDSDQDTNDLTKAFNWAVEGGYANIIIVGATGLREDHCIGNVFLLILYMQKASVTMLTDYGIFTPIEKTTSFSSFSGQQVSLFSPLGAQVSTLNLKYPLNKAVLDQLWKGTLNESESDEFTVITDKPLIVYRQI